jgi:hypothetical protein
MYRGYYDSENEQKAYSVGVKMFLYPKRVINHKCVVKLIIHQSLKISNDGDPALKDE